MFKKFRVSLAITTILGAGLAAPALAETPITPVASVEKTLDDYGVDLATGALNLSIADISAGNEAGGIAHRRHWISRGRWRDEYDYTLTIGSNKATVSLGATTLTLTLSGGTYISDQGNGATLTQSGGKYVLTTADGTITRFGYWDTFDGIRATESISPDGSKLTFQYETKFYYDTQYRESMQMSRLKSVTNTSGFRVSYAYAVQTLTQENQRDWLRRTAVEVTNTQQSTAGVIGSTRYSNLPSGSSEMTVTDHVGNVYRYGLNSSGQITSITRPGDSGSSVSIAYNNVGRISSVADVTGTTIYTYSDSGSTRTTRVTNPHNQVSVYTFQMPSQRMLSATDPVGGQTRWAYDSYGRVASITRPNGTVEQRSYDSHGNLVNTTLLPASGSSETPISSTASYPCASAATCNKPSWVRDAKGNQTDYTYDQTTGNVVTVASPPDAAGVRAVVNMQYTAIGGVQKLTRTSLCLSGASCAGSASEQVTEIAYGTNGWVSSVTQRAGDNSVSSTSSMTYNALGDTTSVDGPLSGASDTTYFRYDALRRRIGIVSADPDGAGPRLRRAERTTYDARGRAIRAEAGTVADASDASWNNFNSVQQTEVSYDTADRSLVERFQSGSTVYSVTQNTYSGQRLACQVVRMNKAARTGTLPSACTAQTPGEDGPDRIASFEYDAANRVTRVTQGVGTSEAAAERTIYNTAGNIIAVIDANENQASYAYDGFGQLRQTTFPGGSYELVTRDVNGNITSRRLRDGNTIGYGYDARNRLISLDLPQIAIHEYDRFYSYDQAGNLIQARDSNGHYANSSFDALGRQLSESSNFSTRSFTYDAAGRRTSLTWHDGLRVTYDYFDNGQMRSIKENGSFDLAQFEYDDLGRRTRLIRGNGTVTNYAYNSGSELLQLHHDLGGTSNDYTANFTTTAAGQIKSRSQANATFRWTGNVAVDRAYSVNVLNQYSQAGTTGFQYDGRGNLIRSGDTTYQYTAENNLAQGPGGFLAYDPLGRLHTENDSNFLQYDGQDLITEMAGGVIQRRYVHGPGADEPLVWYEGTGTADRRWLIADERGSVIAVTNQAGNAIAINRYDEFGIPSLDNLGRFQYTGQTWLPAQGLYYYKARVYSPTLGRFMQADPIGYDDGMNMYAYVGNDPVNNIDPTGMFGIVVTGPVAKVGIPVAAKIGGAVIGAIGGFLGFGGSSAAAKLAKAQSLVRGEQASRSIDPTITVTAPQNVFGAWNPAIAIPPMFAQVAPEIIVRGQRPQKEKPKPKGDLKQCLLGVGGKLLEGVLDPVGVVANGAAAVAVGAGYDVARYNATAGGVIVESGTKLAPAGGAVSRFSIARAGGILAAKLFVAGTAVVAVGYASYYAYNSKDCRPNQ